MSNHLLLVAQSQPGGFEQFIVSTAPLLMIFAIFYFIWFVPLRKKQRQLEETIAALTKGDKVVTNGGLLGEIVKAEGPVVVLKIADNVRVRVRRAAIAGLEGTPEAEGKQP